MPNSKFTIKKRFNGPPTSANGGYTAGMLAKSLVGDVAVVLRSPPPLEAELEVHMANGSADLLHEDKLIATAHQTVLELAVPACPEVSQIEASHDHYPSVDESVFATCFVCGPARKHGDGLNVFPVALNDDSCVASHWVPVDNMVDADGLVATEILWAALDCPGYFAHRAKNVLMLLGSMTASIAYRPEPNQPLVVMGWQIGVDGRKYYSGTAIFDHAGSLCAKSTQTWVKLK
ncbi:hypothetical protein [Arenicella xantha]|nr:hypothetical protein [Arenicella xantha]